jgi:hypothetical protein
MYGSSRVRHLLFALLLLASPVMSAAATENLGAHRVGDLDEFQRVVDISCTLCHTRERVDVAMRERQDMERLQRQMEERGAVLSERDKAVLGTFWGSPLKER